MNNLASEYVDEYFNVHKHTRILGAGGQGVVYRTTDPDLAIKLVTDSQGTPISDLDKIATYSDAFKMVRLLPLPSGINVSVPVAILKNKAGYVMRLLSEMEPFSQFWMDGQAKEKIKKEDIPKWLSEIPEDEARKIVYYAQTGGLRRRLTALYKCAVILSQLHGRGLVYGDISPNNAFISSDMNHSSVWLIDADNLRFDRAYGGTGVYTPKYGAFELVRGEDMGHPATDCHAFAVMAFYMLSMIHPFYGKKVDGSDDGSDWADDSNDDEDVETKAYRGEYPWVDDCDDDSNSSESGLPRALLLTQRLSCLFQLTFGDGRTSSWKRPCIFHWPEALAQAADLSLECPSCKMSWFYNVDGNACPYCDCDKPQMLILKAYTLTGSETSEPEPVWTFARELSFGSPVRIPNRLFHTFTMDDSDDGEIDIGIDEKGFSIGICDGSKLELSIAISDDPEHPFKPLYSKMILDMKYNKPSFWLLVKSKQPRIIVCSVVKGDAK